MIPEIGKWYMIKKSDEYTYFGPAKCIGVLGPNYRFVEPATQHCDSFYGSFILKSDDIEQECNPLPSYLDLMKQLGMSHLSEEKQSYRQYLEECNAKS